MADRPTLVFDTKAIPGGGDGKETCPRSVNLQPFREILKSFAFNHRDMDIHRCGGRVFHAEKMMSKNHCYHKVRC